MDVVRNGGHRVYCASPLIPCSSPTGLKQKFKYKIKIFKIVTAEHKTKFYFEHMALSNYTSCTPMKPGLSQSLESGVL